MACGLPVVASGVGVNTEIVQPGRNGYLADTAAAWLEALRTLLADAPLRAGMGQDGRQRVENSYCLQQTAPRLAALLRSAARPSV
jgi:glycosyltransferase involved in cell wall biosynthesis